MIPTAGEWFGPYEILGTLGRGGVGEVYRAWDARLQREVAVKVLHDDYPQPSNRERFVIEARAASALNHANICTIFDIGEKDGAPYLVMELLKGETLKQRIERGGIPSDEIAQYGIEMAEALGAAHALGIVHRDIKPANVMLVRQPDGRCRVKVLDFGLAKLTGPLPGDLNHRDEHLTVVGEAVGTVSYMSPEQARGDELDGRSDLFSLGVVMYEMATRRTPFHGSTSALLFVQLLNHAPEPIHDWNDSVPRALEKAILKLLEKEPARRFQTTADVVAALHSAAAKGSESRWRRSSSPAVPLVRVEEPVARAGLPNRPDFRQDYGVVGLGVGARRERPAEADTPGEGRRVRPRSAGTPVERAHESAGVRVPSGAAKLYREPALLRRRSASVGSVEETPVGSLPAVFDEVEAAPVVTADIQHESRADRVDLPRIGAFAFAAARRSTASVSGSPILLRAAVVGTVLGVLGGAFAASRLSPRSKALLAPSDTLLITDVENQTAVQSFDGSIAAGLDLSLSQSQDFLVRGVGAYRAEIHSMGADGRPDSALQARQAARAAGARAYLYGEVREGEEGAHSSGAGYTLSVAVNDTSSNRELAHAEAKAARTQEIPGAIDEVASALRNQLLGRPAESAPALSVPLAREATGNLNALRAFAAGAKAEAENRPEAALKAYGIAAAADPNFVQANVQISWLARMLGSDLASAEAAVRAQSALRGRSSRTAQLARIAADANAPGDLSAAASTAEHLATEHPDDPEVLLAYARVLRLQGRFPEALSVAEHGIKAAKRDGELYREAELSLLGRDLYNQALTLEESASALGFPHPDVALYAAYLGGKNSRVPAVDAGDDSANSQVLAARATLLDNTGDRTAAATAWREAAESTRAQAGLVGAGVVLIARGALDRALAGDCPAAVALGRDALTRPATSPDSAYSAGLAGALCGDEALARAGIAGLSAVRAQSSRASALRAATLMGQGHVDGALTELATIRAVDVTYLTPYLRGMAHLAAHDAAASAKDFQEVLAHRGAALTGGTDVYPAAQLGLSKALAAAGDLPASEQAYSRFRQLWSAAGAADRPAGETQVGTRLAGANLPARSLNGGAGSGGLRESRAATRTGVPAAWPTQTYAADKTVLTAWPDRPAHLAGNAQERKFQSVRDGELE